VGLFRESDQLVTRMPGNRFVAPVELDHPCIRCVDTRRIVLADLGSLEGPNAWILRARQVETAFRPGDDIAGILASDHSIVVTYFDEGVSGGRGLGHEGIAVFDDPGTLRSGYRTRLGNDAVRILDV
jgi:hypothetical protein